MKKASKIQNFITYKNVAYIMIGVLTISLLPLIYCSFFNYATGDDLWEGAAAYHVLQSGGGILELFSRVFEWMKVDYYGWQGNWSSTFLWCFSPNVFGEKVYVITAWIGLISICVGNRYFIRYFNNKYLKINKDVEIIIYSIICFVSIQYMPYIRGGIFWYSGMINYTFPYGMTLAAFVWLDKWMEKGESKYLIFLSFFYAFLGGSGYLCIVLNFEIAMMILISTFLKKDKVCKKRSIYLLIPLVLLLIGFTVSLLSPGNAVRGGEYYVFGIARVLDTLYQCLLSGVIAIPTNLWEIKLLVVILPIIGIIIWNALETNRCKIRFNHPLIVTILVYLISCSVYAPGIYSKSDLSGGVYDTIYFVFVLGYFMILIYWIGYVKKIVEKKQSLAQWMKKIDINQLERIVAIFTILLCIIGSRFLFSNTAYKLSYDFIISGQLADFEEQMQERLAILNNPEIENAILPEMNDQQGPIMHMPLMANPDAYTNYATARYYGKKSVVAIPRDEYNRLYRNDAGK